MKFKKISAILGATLMAGLTFGTAAAANFPAPFVDSGVANVAVVWGSGAGVSVQDQVSANNIQAALAESMPSSGSKVTIDGDSFKLERTSNKFTMGDSLNSSYQSLSDEELAILADGKYRDGDVNTDYSQKITLGGNTLRYFKDSSFNDNEPVIGFAFSSGESILKYQITFDDAVNTTEMEGTDLPLLGKEYYVKDASTTEIILYDSAEKVIIERDETLTVNGKSVTLEFLGDNGARFNIDGESIKSLGVNQDYELKDGSFIVVSDIMLSGKESVTDKVEFSIGKGKIELRNNSEVVMGDETIRGLYTIIEDESDDIKSITLDWRSYRKTFLGEGDSIAMPGFEGLGLVFGGLDYPTSSEKISLLNGDVLVLEMGHYNLPLAWIDDGDIALGEDGYPLLLSVADESDSDTGVFGENNSDYNETSTVASGADFASGLLITEGDRFIVTNLDTYLSDVTTLYYEVDRIVYTSSSDFEVVLRDQIGSNDLTFTSLRSRDRGDVTVTLAGVGEHITSSEGVAYLTFSDDVYFDIAVSETGLIANLSAFNVEGTMNITFTEANEKDQINDGEEFTVTVVNNTDGDRLHVNAVDIQTLSSSSNRDLYTGVVISELATKVTWDKSGDENDFEIEYFGKEVTADVQVVSGEVEIISGGSSALGDIVVKDTEVDAVKAKNLIIVGGSCINSAAANVLGVSERTCGEAFTAATGVGPNQFLIQSVGDAYTKGKVALVVAGYEMADTAAAATYLRTQDVNTAAGQKKIYSTTTNTEVM